MINVSDAFKQKLQDGEKVWQEVEITFPDGTVKTAKDEIMGENCTYSDCAESSSFPIGCVVCKSMTLELDNSSDQWKDYYFYMAKVHAFLKMQIDSETVETIDKGIYTITTPEQYGELLSFTALDNMYKANATYTSKLVLPQTVISLVRDACETLDIPMGFSSMAHGNLIINEIPDNMTFRQLFGWVAMLEAANARLDNRGYLQFVKWNFSAELIELKDYIDMPTVSSDDIIITGIRIKNGDNSELYGESGYVIELENNLVEEADLATVAAQIGDSIIGAKFRSMNGELTFNPLIEFGDMAYTYDRKWNRYITPLTDVSCSVNGKTTVKTQADDPIRGQSKFQSEATKAIVEARRLVKKEKSAREKAVERLEETLKNSSGLYETSVTQEDDSTITYLHDKPTLAESKNVIKFTAEAIGVSNDGGKTYPYGFVLTGEMITRLLYAEGINATYINTGVLIVKDKNGKVIFSADMDSGTVKIDASYIQIGGSALDKALDNMQGQIDGNIETWTGTDTPTLDNYPANNWLTDDERSKHVGDVYYDSKNQGYRFRNDGSGYVWQMVKDTDITKALQDAAEAKESAANAEKAAGLARNMTLQLSNEVQTIASDAEGNIPTFPVVSTQATVMYGTQDITDNCSFTITKSDSVTGSWSDATHIYNVTGLSADNGWVDIKAVYLSKLSVTKRFTISKQKQGERGIPGIGQDGKTSYFHIRYSAVENPTSSSQMTKIPSTYIGTYVDFTETDSIDPSKYTWARFEGMQGERGEQGIPGIGTDGKTSYLHIAYANSADGKTDFSISDGTGKKYMGQYTDFEPNDSTDSTKYTWSLIQGNDGSPGRTYMIEPSCNVLKRSADNTISPNFVEFKAYYRDGNSATRTAYRGRFVIEETTDGNTWKTIYTSAEDEDTVKHYLYTILTNMSNEILTSSNGSTVGIPRDVVNVRCKLYASGGTTTLIDMQSVAVVVDVDALTQEDILNFLTNNGQWKGIYKGTDGELYISFSAAMGGLLKLGGKNNGNGVLHIYDTNGKIKATLNYNGLVVYENPLNPDPTVSQTYSGLLFDGASIHPIEGKTNLSDDDEIIIVADDRGISYSRINDDGKLIFEATFEELYTDFFSCDEFYCRSGEAKLDSLEIKDVVTMANTPNQYDTYATFYKEVDFRGGITLHKYPTVTTGYNCYINMNTFQLSRFSSSSERYKILGAELSKEFVDNLYNIEPIMARYKDGYLDEHDERVGIEFPMFNADDVDRYFPLAVDHIDGKPENWNERIMIPAMFAMIKEQKTQIDKQEKLINELYKKLNIKL